MFGTQVLAVDEWFLDGVGRLELPLETSEGPNIDQGANLALWAEAVWMPSVWVTDRRARWTPLDDSSAHLTVPHGDDEETFTVRFDRGTGLLVSLESLRVRCEGDTTRTGWRNEALDWGRVDGAAVPERARVAWEDEDSPWADLHTEQVVYNADLTEHVRAGGP